MKRWAQIGGVVALASLLVGAAFLLPVTHWVMELAAWMREAGPSGIAAFAVVYVLATVLMLPASPLTAAAGLVYGPVWGTVLVSPVSVVAATLAFQLGRTLARNWVATRAAGDARFRAVDQAVGIHGLRIVTLLRLSPLFPFNILNYTLGLTRVRRRDYVIGSAVGMLPGTFLYVYLGSLVVDVASLSGPSDQASAARRILSVAGFAATVLVTVYVTRIARRALAKELATAGSEPEAK